MLSGLIAPALARRGIHYGWVMVAVTFLVALCSAGSLGVLGALLLPVKRDFGWDTSSISAVLAVRILIYGLMGPFAAALMQRYGLQRVVAAALALVVTGSLLSTTMTTLWELWLYWGVMIGVGSGMTALVLGATVANRWFVERRGLVMGMLTAANATGQLAFLPLAAWLAEHYGWRVAILPAMGGCVLAALLMILLRPRPARRARPARLSATARVERDRAADRQSGAQRRRGAGRGVAARAFSGSCSRPSSSAACRPTA